MNTTEKTHAEILDNARSMSAQELRGLYHQVKAEAERTGASIEWGKLADALHELHTQRAEKELKKRQQREVLPGIVTVVREVLEAAQVAPERISTHYSDVWVLCSNRAEAEAISQRLLNLENPWLGRVFDTNPDHEDSKEYPHLVDIPFAYADFFDDTPEQDARVLQEEADEAERALIDVARLNDEPTVERHRSQLAAAEKHAGL